jgi:hypothetical protein
LISAVELRDLVIEVAARGHLAACDLPHRNDLDGRGNLSEENLAEFTKFPGYPSNRTGLRRSAGYQNERRKWAIPFRTGL